MNASTSTSTLPPGRWNHGELPPNVVAGENTLVLGEHAFKRFRTRQPGALVLGRHCTLDGVHFAVGEKGRMSLGDYCYLTNVVLLCELEVRIGNHVMIGWNTTIADSDFHPLAPAERIADAIACSPLGHVRPRPAVAMKPVIIEDGACLGPNVTLLKGVRVGAGAFIEAGSLVTKDVPPGATVLGNPAQIVS